MLINFATRSYKSSSLPLSAQRVVNMYAEKEPPDAKTQVALFGCPGLDLFASLGAGPLRGFRLMDGVLYAVSGQLLYSVTSSGVSVALGGNISGSGPVSMSDNGTQLVIVNGTAGYIYTVVGGFALITDTDFAPASTVEFFDSRFVFDEKDAVNFFISEALDGASYVSSEYASAETRPDDVQAVVLNRQVLIVFGKASTETWQDVGAANFPYQRIEGAMIERGLMAPLATTKEDNFVFFLGDDRCVYRIAGIQSERISDHSIEQAIQDYAVVSDCFAISYNFDGHKFIAFTFPTQAATWVYDLMSGLWHERESWDEHENPLGRWRANCAISAYGHQLIGDAFSGKIGKMSKTVYTEFDNVIHGSATAPPLHSDRKRMFFSRFEMDIESGVGITTGQGSDPQAMMDYSDDGGRTFSVPQRWRSMGQKGAYRQRLRWLRLGQSRERIYRISISDPVRRTVINAHADMSVGQ